jgi:ABC-type uncharacterized transport system auxiliary subunit
MKYIWLALVVLLLSSCSFSAGNTPADHFYRLPMPTQVSVAFAVNIAPVRAEGIYNERALLFVEKSYPLEINRYDYHFWSQTPSKLVQTYLQSCLTSSDVVKMPANTQQAIQLSPMIESFERVLEKGKAEAVVKLRLNQRVYESRIMADSMDMHATVAAYGQAMQTVCEAIAHDL